MSELIASINGEQIALHRAVLSVQDLSVERGYAIFDYFKTVHGKPIFLEDSLDRFFHSAEKMRLRIPYNRDQLKVMLNELMQVNQISESGIKLLLTGGYSPDGYSISTPNLVITQQPLKRNISLEQQGLRLVTFEHQRQLPEIKTTDYLAGILAQPYAKEHHAADILYTHNKLVLECPRCNIFIVNAANELITPGRNILKGITRKHILLLASSIMTAKESDLSLEDLYHAREVFISSTSKNITPVNAIDHITYGKEPGPVTRNLQSLLEAVVYSNV